MNLLDSGNEMVVPNYILTDWQNIVNTMANVMNVPAAAITQIGESWIQILFSNQSEGNPLRTMVDKMPLAGYYCEEVMATGKKLLIPNALKDPRWEDNPDSKIGLISYLGLPLNWSDGRVFGTLCVFDAKENHYSHGEQELMAQVKQLIETHFRLIYRESELKASVVERNRAEADQRKLSRVVEQTTDIVYITSPDAVIEYVNPAFEQFTGYTREEAIGKNPGEILRSGHHNEAFYRELWETILAGKSFHAVVLNRRKDGELFYEEKTITPLKDVDGNVTHFVSTGRDVTQNKRTEAALRQSELRFRALFEGVPDAIFLADPHTGKVTDVNQAALTLLQKSRREIIGIHQTDLHPPRLRGHLRQMFDEFAQGIDQGEELSIATETYVLRSDGSEVPVDIMGTVVQVQDKLIVLGIFRDITERHQAEETLKQRNRELALLNQANQLFTATLELDQVLDTVLDVMHTLFGTSLSSVWLIDPKTHEVVCQRVVSTQYQVEPGQRLAIGEGIVGLVAQHDKSLLIADAKNDRRFAPLPGWPHRDELRSMLNLPLRVNQQVIGVLQLIDTNRANRFSTTDITLVEALVATASMAIENARLFSQVRRLSIIDELTQLHNRRFFDGRLQEEQQRAFRYTRHLALIMLDIDHFKQVNDTYGHPVGDVVLAELAQIVQQHVRETDVIGRYGGEEFAVILPETNLAHAVQVAEKIRQAVAEHVFVVGEHRLRITISLGIDALQGFYPDAPDALVKQADQALYQAKREGRNRVIAYSSG